MKKDLGIFYSHRLNAVTKKETCKKQVSFGINKPNCLKACYMKEVPLL
jgi:hypothetical protein